MNSAVAQGPVALLDTLAPAPPLLTLAGPALGLDDPEELSVLRIPGPAAPEIAELEAALEAADDVEEDKEADRKVSAWAYSACPAGDLFRQYLREIGRIAADRRGGGRAGPGVEAGLFAEEKLTRLPDLLADRSPSLDPGPARGGRLSGG